MAKSNSNPRGSSASDKLKFDKQKPIIKTKNTKEFLKYEFSKDEIHQKGADLARVNSELVSIDSEARSVAANFKAKKEGKITEIEMLSNHINNGYEHRYIDCEVRFHDPNTGVKTTARKDTGEIVRKESMSQDEMQLELDIPDATAKD